MDYKIVHLTSVHRFNDIRIFLKECRTLQNRFSEIGLITPHTKNEVVDNVKIFAVPKVKSRKERMLKTVWQVYHSAIKQNADIYHFHDPELIPVGLLLKAKKKKVIYDVHEDVPKQILSKYWIPTALRKVISWVMVILEKVSAHIFNGVVAATPSIAKRFPANKTVVVQNFPIINELFLKGQVDYNKRPHNVVYIGGISKIRGIKEIVQAIDIISKTEDTKLVLAGKFTPASLEEEISDLPGWKHTDFKGWVSREEAANILSEARIGLVLFHPEPNHMQAWPNKLFEYMSAGIPVIASDFTLWREIVSASDCGLLVDPLDPNAIAEAINWLFEHPEEAEQMGRRGREAVLKHYNWDNEAEKLISFYKKVLSKQGESN